ncbi:arylamine N-acetyltransferase family protein [Nonomuraea gerenzanensis]|nr:arylamine N-acetyltransferase [Nonomuraea gerenzanensis]UBU18021.1 arylamine N-acetyltransferase [Nonomuraea gerenzanensis]
MRRPHDRDLSTYLDRLEIGDPGEPSLDALRALHRAHVERVPYETLEVQLGRRITLDPRESIDRILRGRGGYCVQLNGAFATLLTALGYDVTWHRAGVQAGRRAPASGVSFAPHLALTVRMEGQPWLVDIGLGDGLLEPLPLREGRYRQGPFEFRLSASSVEPGGWRFDHDPRGSIAGLDMETEPASAVDFVEWHPYLCTSPESRLVRAAVVLRRDGAGADALVGCMLRRVSGAGVSEVELGSRGEWFEALSSVFGLHLGDVNGRDREMLWEKVRGAHEAWQRRKGAVAVS